MQELAPHLHTDDAEILFTASEMMHRRKPQFADRVVLLRVIGAYSNAMHFEAQGDHFHAAEAYSTGASEIVASAFPTPANLAWAQDLLDSARINLEKHVKENPDQKDSTPVTLLEVGIGATKVGVHFLAAQEDLPERRL